MPDFVIGRQQIFDRDLRVFGYELLVRDVTVDPADTMVGALVSNQVVVDALLEQGLDRLVGAHRAFINFARRNLIDGVPLLLPKDRVVVEVLETVRIDTPVVMAVQNLARQGYHIALDDFVFSEMWRPLMEVADIIKIDILQQSPQELADLVKVLQPYRAKLLAEKVESDEQYTLYRDLGFEYFQGFHFDRPKIMRGRRLETHHRAIVQVLDALKAPALDIDALSQAVCLDVALSYKLLRYANSESHDTRRDIDSIRQALTRLGAPDIRRWADLLSLTTAPYSPDELTFIALIRAKMCELLALQCGKPSERYFLVGLLSLLDEMLDAPLEQIVHDLPISEEISNALVYRTGDAGQALDCAVNYESWNLDQVAYQNLKVYQIGQIYLESVAWANALNQAA